MAARLAVLCVSFVTFALPPAWASDAIGAADHQSASAWLGEVTETVEARTVVEPTISPRVPKRNREQIVAGFRVALERVAEVPECREMFSELGADADITLDGMRFYPIGGHELKANVCGDRAVHTVVGGGPIWVCRKFSRLSVSKAAMVVIHEALHHAGLTEKPHDPDGMTSGAINDMVLKRCGL